MSDDKTIRALGLPGSLRRLSYNHRLLKTARTLAPPGMHVTVFDHLAKIPLFSEDLEAESVGGPDSVKVLRMAVASSDGLLIATPEYNQSIPGVLKNAIDWLSRPGPTKILENKPVALVGATVGPWGTRFAQQVVRHVLTANQSFVMPGPQLYIRNAASLFDGDGDLTDAKTLEQLESLLLAFATWIELFPKS